MSAVRDKTEWAAAPLLASAALFALPLTFDYRESTRLTAADVSDATLESVSSFAFERSLVPALVALVLYGFAAWKCARAPRIVRLFDRRTLGAPILVLLVAASAFWSDYPAKVGASTAHALGAVLMAAAAAARYRSDPRSAIRHIGLALGANVLLNMIALVTVPALSIDWDDRWRGLLGNANLLGLVCMCSIWANVVAAGTRRGAWRVVHAALATLALAGLLGTRSATSLVCTIVAVGGHGALSLLGRIHPPRARRLLAAASLAFFIPVALVAIEVIDSRLWGSLAEGLGKSSDMTGRTVLWLQALDLIATRPAFGWGFDTNATVIRMASLPAAHFHNGYLDLMVRGGLAALAVVIMLMAQALSCLRQAGRTAGLDVLSTYAPLLLSVAIYNITEVTFATDRNISWLLVLFVLFVARHYARNAKPAASSRLPQGAPRRTAGVWPPLEQGDSVLPVEPRAGSHR